MSKSKEVAVMVNADLESTVIKPIKLTIKDKVGSVALPAVPAGLIMLGGTLGTVTSGDPSFVLTALTASGFLGSLSGILMFFDKAAKIDRTFFGNESTELTIKQRWKARKERLLINTIHIKEKVDVSIEDWQDPKNAVPEHEATHTVRQYLLKTRQGFRVEQEISPNNEAIWDMSADALVEVYGVQEKTESMREVTA